MGTALMRFGVRQHARAEPISKPAPSALAICSRQCIRPAALRRARRLGAELGTERNGSIDRHFPNAPPRDTSARASGPERTTDQISGRRIMRVTRRAPISCRHCCRRKEPLRSHQRSGCVERRRFAPSPRAGRDNFRDNRGDSGLPLTGSLSYT